MLSPNCKGVFSFCQDLLEHHIMDQDYTVAYGMHILRQHKFSSTAFIISTALAMADLPERFISTVNVGWLPNNHKET